MITFLAVCAALGTLASMARPIVALLDYRARWHRDPVHLYRRPKEER